MGQTTRTTKLLLDLSKRKDGGTNTDKRAALAATVEVLNAVRAFYIDFFFPHLPFIYRRSVIKDAIGKVRSYFSNRANWQKTGKKKGRPGWPGPADHPTLYQGTCTLHLESTEVTSRFVQLKVYDGKVWVWVNYPVRCSRYFEQRYHEQG